MRSTGRHPRATTPQQALSCEKPRFVEPAHGIAIVSGEYRYDVNGCLRVLHTQRSLEDTLSLVDGQTPTFLSYSCRHHRNRRQQKAHKRCMYLKACGHNVPAHKCQLRQRLESTGGVLIMDDYLNGHMDSAVAEVSAPYRQHFDSHPPGPNRNARPRQQLSKRTAYLVNEAVQGHRPVFERIPTTEVYGEGYAYTQATEPAALSEVPAVSRSVKQPSCVTVMTDERDGDDSHDNRLTPSRSLSADALWTDVSASPDVDNTAAPFLGVRTAVCC